jgi:hypothetical protein
MNKLATPPMLAKTTNLARPAIRSTYRSYRERSADRGLNGAASALLLRRDAFDGVAGVGAATMYIVLRRRRVAAREMRKKPSVYKVLLIPNTFTLVSFMFLFAWGTPQTIHYSLFWNFREPLQPSIRIDYSDIGDMMVKQKLWFG